MSDIHITGYRAHKVRITEEGVRVEFKAAGGDITALVLREGVLYRVDGNGLYNLDSPLHASTAAVEAYETLTENFIKGIAAHIHDKELGHTAIHDLTTHLAQWQPRFFASKSSHMSFDVGKVVTGLEQHKKDGGVKQLPQLIDGYQTLKESLDGLPANQADAVKQARALSEKGRKVLTADKYETINLLMTNLPTRLSRTLTADVSPIVEQIHNRLTNSPNTNWTHEAMEFIKSPEKEGRQEYLDTHYPPNKAMRMADNIKGSILPKEPPKGKISHGGLY